MPPDATPPSPCLFFVAGEPSGDLHAAHLMRELAKQRPGIRFRGFGGHRMRDAGLDCLEDLPSQAIMGLFPVIAALPRIRGWFRRAVESLRNDPPDAIVLVDYPGFNLRLAARAKKLGIPVIYYISPQVWAWNRRRVKTIARVVDLMIVILPFEADFYRDSGVEVFYSGHPLVDHLASSPADPKFVDTLRDGGESPIVGVFPGSRGHVVDSLLPIFVRTARRLLDHEDFAQSLFLFAAANDDIAKRIAGLEALKSIPHRIVTSRPYEVMEASDLCLTTSGTTTLEIALHRRPMVLAYRVSRVFWLLGRLLIRVRFIGLVNLIAGRGIVREHIGTRSFHAALAADLIRIRTDREVRETLLRDLDEVRRRLETPGSYRRSAARLLEQLGIETTDSELR